MKMIINDLRRFIAGREDDGKVTTVEIDCSNWKTLYPNLTDYRLEVKSPGKVVYLPVVRMDGNKLIWEITQSDTAESGIGQYQVVATGADGARKTSMVAEFVISSVISGTASETPPDPSKPWVEKVVDAAKRAEDAAERAENAGGGGEGGSGEPGEDGEDGGYYKPNIDKDGALSWEASKEDMPDVPSTNIRGPEGKQGPAGYTPQKGVDYFDGKDGADGAPGKDGKDGEPGPEGKQGPAGRTPVKGEDYWTETDKQEIVSDVLAALPVWEGGEY